MNDKWRNGALNVLLAISVLVCAGFTGRGVTLRGVSSNVGEYVTPPTTLPPGTTLPPVTTTTLPPVAICGNGIIEGGEACDDSNTINGDGCALGCSVESGWTCSGQPSSCTYQGGFIPLRTLYVVPTGGATAGICPSGTPCTLAYAASIVIPGDEVRLRSQVGGVPTQYVPTSALTISRAGNATNPIWFTADDPSNPPTINGATMGQTGWTGVVIFGSTAAYIVWNNINITNGTRANILFSGSGTNAAPRYITVQNSTISNASSTLLCSTSGGSGWYSNIVINPANGVQNYITIKNNTITGALMGGIVLWNGAGHILIEDNTLTGNRGCDNYDAIQVGGDTGNSCSGGPCPTASWVVVQNNNVGDNGNGDGATEGGDLIDLNGHSYGNYMLMQGNRMILSGTTGFQPRRFQRAKFNQSYACDATGISMGACTTLNSTDKTLIARRNVIKNTMLDAYGFPAPVVWYNNTLQGYYNSSDGTGTHTIQYWNDGGTVTFGGQELKRNLFIGGGIGPIFRIGGSGAASINLTRTSLILDNDMYRTAGTSGMEWNGGSGIQTYPAGTQPQFQTWQLLNGGHDGNGPEPHGYLTTQTLAQLVTNEATADYRPVVGSDVIDRGLPLTTTVGGGTGNTITLGNVDYFMNGWELIPADHINIGGDTNLEVISTNDDLNTVTVDRVITWQTGEAVDLYCAGGLTCPTGGLWSGAPDIGAHEYGK